MNRSRQQLPCGTSFIEVGRNHDELRLFDVCIHLSMFPTYEARVGIDIFRRQQTHSHRNCLCSECTGRQQWCWPDPEQDIEIHTYIYICIYIYTYTRLRCSYLATKQFLYKTSAVWCCVAQEISQSQVDIERSRRFVQVAASCRNSNGKRRCYGTHMFGRPTIKHVKCINAILNIFRTSILKYA